jgi:hypothetical protein
METFGFGMAQLGMMWVRLLDRKVPPEPLAQQVQLVQQVKQLQQLFT